MSFICSDSCEIGILREKVLAKCACKLPFSEYRGYQSDALEFSIYQLLGQTFWNKMMEEKAGAERQNSKRGFERMSMPALWPCSVEGVFVVPDLSFKGGRPVSENSRLV